MTVSYDAYSELATEERCGDNTLSWTHTPSGTPGAVIVGVTISGTLAVSGDNAITGVTYGGVAMTKASELHKGTGEFLSVWYFELLSGIPAGAQTVSISTNACPLPVSGGYPWFFAHAVTLASGGGAIQRLDLQTLSSDNTTTPSVAVNAGSTTGIAIAVLNTGLSPRSGLTPVAGCTTIGGYDFAGGAISDAVARQSTPATGSFTVGWTQAGDDALLVAASYGEAAAGMPPGRPPGAPQAIHRASRW